MEKEREDKQDEDAVSNKKVLKSKGCTGGETRNNEWLLDQVLPFLMKHITTRSTLLKCRSVCKGWRDAVDKFLEEDHPSRRPFNPDNLVDRINAKRATVYSSLRRCQLEHVQFTPANLHKFLSFPAANPSIPKPPIVIGRALSLCVTGMMCGKDALDEFLNAAKAFLQLHGSHLWHFKFVQYSPHLTSIVFYRILCECLASLPNLRTLEVRCHLDRIDYRPLVPVMEALPLPVLPHLRSMDIEGVSTVLQAHFITQYGTQLDRLLLDMQIHYFEDKDHHKELPVQLKELVLKRVLGDYVLGKLYETTSVAVACVKLTLDMGTCDHINQKFLLEVLHRLPHLLHLRIILHYRCSFSICRSDMLPSVKYFEIEGDDNQMFYFTVLLHALPSLQQLHMRDNSYSGYVGGRPASRLTTDDDAKVDIEKYLQRDAVHESPVWNTLQNLQVFTFESVNGSLKSFCNRETVNHWRQARMSSGSND